MVTLFVPMPRPVLVAVLMPMLAEFVATPAVLIAMPAELMARLAELMATLAEAIHAVLMPGPA
jgi:hypothetical protein